MSAETPVKEIKGTVSVIVLIDGKEIPKVNQVLSIEIVKEINKIPYAKVVLVDGNPGKQNFAHSEEAIFEPGKKIEVKSGFKPGSEKSLFKGIITEMGIKLGTFSGSCLVLKCKDKALGMSIGRKNKMFFKKKDSEIISAIVSEDGLSADVEATSLQHKKLVQHSCSNWDFVLTRADVNGLVTIVEDGKLTIKKPKYSEKTNLKISYGNDLVEMNLNIDSTYQLSEVKSRAWNHTDQKLDTADGAKPTVNKQGDLDLGKLSAVIKPKELLQTPAAVTKDMLKPYADSVWQRQALSRVRGTVKFYGSEKAELGKTIELFGIGKRFVGDGYISKVRHTVEQSQWFTEVELGLPPRMFLEDNPNASALPAGGLLPSIHGLQIGVVKQIHDDPDGEFRVLVNIPTIDNMEGEGIWVRKAHYYATKNAGYFFYPEINDEVVLGFLDNDPTHGVILGSLYSSSKHKTSSDHVPDNKNTFKAISTTEGKLKIEIEDVKKIITIITPKKHKIVMDDDKDSITIEDPVNKNLMVFDSKGILLQAQADITVKTKANFILEATQDIKTKSTANTKMEATANFEIKATAQMKAEGVAGIELKSAAMAKLEGSAMTQVKGGVVMIN
jgi:Rhs element Vgr protein